MESLRKNLSAYTLDDAPEDVRELYKDEFIQLYASKLLQKREMRKDIVIELSYKGFSRASDYS